MGLLSFFFKMGIFCFIFLLGVQIILKDTYIENYIYIIEPDFALEQKLRKAHIPFDGLISTFIACMVPVFNILYITYYLIIGLTTDKNTLYELKQEMRDFLKNDKR